MAHIQLAATVSYELLEARQVLAGYAFGQVPIHSTRGHERFRARWGYRTYDCVPPGPSVNLEPIDILVAAGLNGRLDVKSVASIMTVASEAGRALARISVVFWEIPTERRIDLVKRPNDSSPASPLWEAWETMKTAAGLSVARIHKVLHHKRPKHFPLVDRQTVGSLSAASSQAGDDGYWATIHRDLQEQAGAFEELEGWFWERAQQMEGWPASRQLSRLRIHDILLWCDAVGQRAEAHEAGASFVNG